MSRLTKYEPREYSMFPYQLKDDELSTKLDSIHKLGKLEDLEEQLGCPLEVREKAFDNGFYDVDGNHYFCEHYVPFLESMHTSGIMNGREKHFNLKDYGKTWWLKGDKVE